MKTRRLKYSYRHSASKLHKAVGEVLRNGTFSQFKIYQEYPVNKINPDFSDGRCKFDWVILDLKIVLECNGRQHYEEVCFGGDPEKSIGSLARIQHRDEVKKEAAILAGFTYIAIPYWDLKEISETYIFNLLAQAPTSSVPDKPAIKSEPTEYQKIARERARLFRKEQYAKVKAYRKQLKGRDSNGRSIRYPGYNSETQDEKVED